MATNHPVPNASAVLYSGAYADGYYNLTVACNDTFGNGTSASVFFTKSTACIVNITGICDGCRYQDDSITGMIIGCSNNVSITSAAYSINDFAFVSISNTSSFVVNLERGWNRIIFNVSSAVILGIIL